MPRATRIVTPTEESTCALNSCFEQGIEYTVWNAQLNVSESHCVCRFDPGLFCSSVRVLVLKIDAPA